MVTGDNIETAKAIAQQCGIFKPERGDVALEGPVFRLMKDVEVCFSPFQCCMLPCRCLSSQRGAFVGL